MENEPNSTLPSFLLPFFAKTKTTLNSWDNSGPSFKNPTLARVCTWENRGRENRKKGSPEAVLGHASLVGWEAGFSVDTSLLVGGGGGDFNAQGLVRNTCKTNVHVLQLYISFQTPMDSPRYWRMWYHFFFSCRHCRCCRKKGVAGGQSSLFSSSLSFTCRDH